MPASLRTCSTIEYTFTSSFSPEAKDYVQKIEKKIVLVDGKQLAQLMIEHNVGVTVTKVYALKKLDQDFFEAE